MAALDFAVEQGDIRGDREDLSDLIYLVDDTEFPLQATAGVEDCDSTFHEWQTQVLRAPNADNAQTMGSSVTFAAITPTVRLANYTQIFHGPVRVSRTADVIAKAGRASEIDYQIDLEVQALFRDMEGAYCAARGATAPAAGTSGQGGGHIDEKAGGTAGVMAGFPAWCWENFQITEDGAATAATGVAAPTAVTTAGAPLEAGNTLDLDALTIAPLNELIFRDLAADFRAKGAIPDCAIMTPAVKNKFDAFKGYAERWKMADDRAVTGVVDIYQSSFGDIAVYTSSFLDVGTATRSGGTNDEHVLMYQKKFVARGYLTKLQMEPLGKVGDAYDYLLVSECTFVCRNPRAVGLIAGIDPAAAPVIAT